jgi:signal transduction histidine kinase
MADRFESELKAVHGEVIRWARQPEGRTLEEAEAVGWPLEPGATLYVEGDLERPEPPSLPVGITYAPLLSDEGRLQNIVVTVRDITRFRTAEEIKSTFISIISHELKTPVALIKGYASTLRLDDAHWDRAVVQESLTVIEEEADRLTRMIEDLLDASRLQAGGLSLNRADVSLKRLAERQAERFRPQTDRHTIVVDFPENFPVILADETRIEQVIANLVSNAMKYAPGGEIRISGRAQPEHVVSASATKARDRHPRHAAHLDRHRPRRRPAAQREPAWAVSRPGHHRCPRRAIWAAPV